MFKTSVELTSKAEGFFVSVLGQIKICVPGAYVFTTIKTISLFTILSLIEFEIADLLDFEVGKFCSNITYLQNLTENSFGVLIYSVIFEYF